MQARTALVVGACGALGRAVVQAYLQQPHWRVLGVDVVDAHDATPPTPSSPTAATTLTTQAHETSRYTYTCVPHDVSAAQYQEQLLHLVETATTASTGDTSSSDSDSRSAAPVCRLHAVVNVAGGWAGGGVRDDALAATTERMLRQSVLSSMASAHVFALCAAPRALLVLTGAAAATSPTPSMLAYGVAKASVHFLCQSLARDAAALPPDARVVALLPSVLDTAANRASMLQHSSDNNTSSKKEDDDDAKKAMAAVLASWTPPSCIAERVVAWCEDDTAAPPSGALVHVTTQRGRTSFTLHMASGGSVVGIKYDGGVLLAADTLLSYGSLAKWPNIPRIKLVGNYSAVCATGDYADFQEMTRDVATMQEEHTMYSDVDALTPRELFAYLQRRVYKKRCDFEPCLCHFVVIGNKDGDSLLGAIDDVGTCWEDDCVATGYGAHIAIPLLRQAIERAPRNGGGNNALLTRDEALKVLTDCLRVLFYRECRALNRFQIADATPTAVVISDPFEVDTNWQLDGFRFDVTAIIR